MLIIGHWLSANLGDKHQPYVVYRAFANKNPDSIQCIQCVNFSSDGGKPMWFEGSGSGKIKIIGPDEIKGPFHTAIITTGSMDANSAYVGWIAAMIESNPQLTTIIWGGFSRGYLSLAEFARGLLFLRNPRVHYHARSLMDLELYRSIVGHSGGIYAGDPICDYVVKSPMATATATSTIAIVSIHCFEYDRSAFWEQICARVDAILCLDTYADGALVKTLKQKYSQIPVYLCNDPVGVMDILRTKTHVISGRLHGAVLAAAMRIPTTMIAVDAPEQGKGSYKFEAFASMGICRGLHPKTTTLTLEEIFTIPPVNEPAMAKMLQTTQQSLEEFLNRKER